MPRMAEFSSLIAKVTTPADEDLIDGLIALFETALQLLDIPLDGIAESRERHYERAVETLRFFALSEEDNGLLDEYLADKRQTIAIWRSRCRRCHRYVRRNLIAELRGEEPVPNPYSEYWGNASVQLHKLL